MHFEDFWTNSPSIGQNKWTNVIVELNDEKLVIRSKVTENPQDHNRILKRNKFITPPKMNRTLNST